MSARPTVVLTGIGGKLGRLVALRLHLQYQVVGLDPRPRPDLPAAITHLRIDPRRRRAENLFRRRQVQALVHLGGPRGATRDQEESLGAGVTGTQRLFDFCTAYQVPKVVLLSSADVYGPLPGTSQFISEDTALQGDLRYPEMRSLVAIDRMGQSFYWAQPQIATVLLRPAHILGPTLRNGASTYLRLPYYPVILGFDPLLQAIHQEDLVTAIELALAPELRGIFNLAGTEPAPLRRVLAQIGRPQVPVPAPLVRRAFHQLWRLGLTNFPPPEIDHLQYGSVLDTARAAAGLRLRPAWSWPKIVEQFRELGAERAGGRVGARG